MLYLSGFEVKYWAPFVLIGDDVTLDLTGNREEMH